MFRVSVTVASCVGAGSVGWEQHPVHWQAALHVAVPPPPHAWVDEGAQTPSPVHADQADQPPWVHVREWVPQRPQPSTDGPSQLQMFVVPRHFTSTADGHAPEGSPIQRRPE